MTADEIMKSPIWRLRDFVINNLHGGCKILSQGSECTCPLCDLDKVYAENAELKRQLAEREWQPIETAPKDETHFIGFTRKYGAQETCWDDVQAKRRSFDKGENTWPFLLWIPIPPLPAAPKGD